VRRKIVQTVLHLEEEVRSSQVNRKIAHLVQYEHRRGKVAPQRALRWPLCWTALRVLMTSMALAKTRLAQGALSTHDGGGFHHRRPSLRPKSRIGKKSRKPRGESQGKFPQSRRNLKRAPAKRRGKPLCSGFQNSAAFPRLSPEFSRPQRQAERHLLRVCSKVSEKGPPYCWILTATQRSGVIAEPAFG
jgi:hypothetical protein